MPLSISSHQEDWESLCRRAMEAFGRGDKHLAAELLEKALLIRGELSFLYSNLGIVYCTMRRFDDSIRYLRRALELDPGNIEGLLQMGGALYDIGEMVAAERFIERAHELGHPDAHHHLANVRSHIQTRRLTTISAPYRSLLELLVRPMRLSVCMIVKDEEVFLKRCLASLDGVADEIVVVDTGSTDGTIAIAREHGAKVHHFFWQDDFAAARNESLRHATGDWVLILDADEELAPESKAELRQLLARTDVSGYDVLIDNGVGPSGSGLRTVGPAFRLFRRHPNVRFHGIIHEQVIDSAMHAHGKPRADSGVRILHHGYHREVIEARGKGERNLTLLHRQLDRNPRDPSIHYHLARTYMGVDRYEEALRHNTEALELLRSFGASNQTLIYPSLYLTQVRLLAGLKRYDEALAIAKEGEQRFAQHADLVFARGCVLIEQGDLDSALGAFMDCRRMPANTYADRDPDVRGYKAAERIGQVHVQREDWAKVEEWARVALAECPFESSNHHANLAIALLRQERRDEALAAARRAGELDPQNPTAQALLSEMSSVMAAASAPAAKAETPTRRRKKGS